MMEKIEDKLFKLFEDNFINLVNNKITNLDEWINLLNNQIDFNYIHNDTTLLTNFCRLMNNIEIWNIISKFDLDFNYPNSIDATPLIVMCECIKDIEIWKIISKFDLDFNIKTSRPTHIISPFITACKKISDPEIWKIILSFPIDLNNNSISYYSPLLAVFDYIKDPTIIKLILEKAILNNVDFNKPNCYGLTVAHAFCRKNFPIKIWEILLNQSINLNCKSNNDLWNIDHNSTPLTVLCSIDNIDLDIWKLIFEKTTALNFMDKNYWDKTPLSNAFSNIINPEVLKLIINYNIKTLDKLLFKLIKETNLKNDMEIYYNTEYNKLNIKEITTNELYDKYNDWIQNNFNTDGHVNSEELFVCCKGVGSRGYWMPYKIPDNPYSWYFQIANNGIGGPYSLHEYPNGFFPVGFFNPYECEIIFGLIINEKFHGKYKLFPKQKILIFTNTIIPYIPQYGTDMSILMSDKNEPYIVYCNLPWNQINSLLENLSRFNPHQINTNSDVLFNFRTDKNNNIFVVSGDE